MIEPTQRGPGTGNWFWIALASTLVFRAWLAAALPVTADEAYFVQWGRHPAAGYYDHPPMIGWLLAPLASLSDAQWVHRLPSLLAPVLLALGVRSVLRGWLARDAQTADLAALCVLLSPINLWNVLITTDTPLALFSFASLALFLRAAQRESAPLFLLSGMCLGLAFLSKYFAVMLAAGYLAWALLARGAKLRGRALGLTAAGALPFALYNLWWNQGACWSNLMFNTINRHADAGLSAATPLLFLATLAYLGAPFAWQGWRAWPALRARLRQPEARLLALAWLVPLAVFAALSPTRRIGLHWLLSFLPALALSFALLLDRAQLAACARFFAGFAALHALAILVVAALPLETWSANRYYSRMVFLSHPDEVLRSLAPLLERRQLMAGAYSTAALLSYHTRSHVPVFGAGTTHARHDDILTDFRRFDGADMLILRREPPPVEDDRRYFREIEVREVLVRGATFYLVLGRGFDYLAYRDGVLRSVRDRFYRIPSWLPQGGCYFFERYFPGG